MVVGQGFHKALMQPLIQSAPIGGGVGAAAVNVGSGVCVAGAGVDVGSPAGTVSVGTGVFVIVAVKKISGVKVGPGVG